MLLEGHKREDSHLNKYYYRLQEEDGFISQTKRDENIAD